MTCSVCGRDDFLSKLLLAHHLWKTEGFSLKDAKRMAREEEEEEGDLERRTRGEKR